MGPPDPEETARIVARDLPDVARELASLNGMARSLKGAEYATQVQDGGGARGGRGRADRGQETGEDERGEGLVKRGAKGRTEGLVAILARAKL